MKIPVFLDANVWDFLFARQLDLATELPSTDFGILITREAEFEMPAIPEELEAKRAFIRATMERCGVRTDSYFGFFAAALPREEQRVAGFNVGRWATEREIQFMHECRMSPGSKKNPKTKLVRNEADLSLGARSFVGVVLTLDRKQGPLRRAAERGGRVVFLNDFDKSGKSLRQLVCEAWEDNRVAA